MALKRGKTPVNWIFQSPTRHGRRHRTTSPWAKPLLQLTFIRPSKDWEWFLALKDQGCLYRTCALPGQRPKSHRRLYFQKMAVEKASRCSPSSIFCIFHTSSLLTPPKKEIRAGKLLVDPGHLQEGLVGGHPHHRYIKACCRRPMVDRVLKKSTRIADDHAKKLSEASVSLKLTVFKLCCPAHLFPNTPRMLLYSTMGHWVCFTTVQYIATARGKN